MASGRVPTTKPIFFFSLPTPSIKVRSIPRTIVAQYIKSTFIDGVGKLKKKIGLVVGTRPEAIKMAPVYLTLREFFEVDFIATGQHREMFYQGLSPLG